MSSMKIKKIIIIMLCTLCVISQYNSVYIVNAEENTEEVESTEYTDEEIIDESEEVIEEDTDEEIVEEEIAQEETDENNEKSESSRESLTSTDEEEEEGRETVDGYAIINLTSEELSSGDTSSVIQTALDEAYQYATESVPYKIIIASGSYTLSSCLFVSSNTYLYAQGCTFTQEYVQDGATVTEADRISKTMIKIASSNTDAESAEGYCYKNITIDGGIWDKNGNNRSLLIMAHGYNITVKNVTFTNACNAHLVEVAGCNGVTFSNCTFSDQSLDYDASSKTYEAIQLDILEDNHILGYNCEDLTLKNVSITGCTFDNVVRGVGSHSCTFNNPYNTITIKNNTFTNIKSCAIQLMNVINTTIIDNTISAPRGIYVYTYRNYGCFYGTTLAGQGTTTSSTSSSYKTPTDSNITISSNKISRTSSDNYSSYSEAGIYVCGYKAVKGYTPTSGDTLPAGNYYLKGVTVSSNTITSNKYGILVDNVYDSSISSKTVTNSSKTSYSGIVVYGSSSNDTVYKNTISGFYRGISLHEDSEIGAITYNTVKNNGYYGINVYDYSFASSVSNNTITNPGENGINVSSHSSVTNINSNSISTTSGSGIYIYNNSKATNINSNTLTDLGYNGIYIIKSTITSIQSNKIKTTENCGISVYNSATVSNIKSNTITKSGSYGIAVMASSKVTTISSNTIKNGSSRGISITSAKVAMSVKSNTIYQCKGYSIYTNPNSTTYRISIKSNTITGLSKKYVGIYAKSGKITVQSNTIKSCSYPVQVKKAVKANIYKNTLSSNKTNKYRISTSNYSNLSTPSLSISTKTKNSIKLKWTKISGTGYKIYRSKSKGGTYSLVKTVSKKSTLTYTNKKLSRKTTYYYKIRSYRKVGNSYIYGSYSSIKSGKTK